MKVGIVCYASTGGSGIVATELAIALARRHHPGGPVIPVEHYIALSGLLFTIGGIGFLVVRLVRAWLRCGKV